MILRIWLVGFAGHRAVEDACGVKEVLRRELRELAADIRGEVVGISSAAAGADLLFLEVCRELGMKTIVILPFARQRFAEDFENPADWACARELIDTAYWSEVVPGGEEAPAAYHRVSRELLDLADSMIFLWNGESAKGLGGTGETVAEAKEWGIPSKIIDAATLQSRWLAGIPPKPSDDIEFRDLPAAASVQSLFEKLDQQATVSAPRYRWFSAGSMSVNTVAVLLQASLLALGKERNFGGFIRIALVLVAAALPWIGSRLRLQERWVGDRVRAELLRSLLATHGLGSPLRPPAIDRFGKDAGLIRSASLRLVSERQDWEAARTAYVTSRLDEQIRYLREKGHLAACRMRWFSWLFNICSWGAIVAAGAVVVSYLADFNVDSQMRRWTIGFLPAVLPGLAAWSMAIISVFEFKRRSDLYAQMVEELERIRPRVAAARCASAAAAAVHQCERLLLNELWEWQGPRRK